MRKWVFVCRIYQHFDMSYVRRLSYCPPCVETATAIDPTPYIAPSNLALQFENSIGPNTFVIYDPLTKTYSYVVSVGVTPATLSLTEGGQQTLSTFVMPGYLEVRFTSLDPAIATVDPVSGQVTGVAPGTTTVRAYALDFPDAYGETTVNVGS